MGSCFSLPFTFHTYPMAAITPSPITTKRYCVRWAYLHVLSHKHVIGRTFEVTKRKTRKLYPYIAEPGVCRRRQCPRLHLCFANACYQTPCRSISRGRIHGIFGSHAASNRINTYWNILISPVFPIRFAVVSMLLRRFYTAIRVATLSSRTSILLIISTRLFMFCSWGGASYQI